MFALFATLCDENGPAEGVFADQFGYVDYEEFDAEEFCRVGMFKTKARAIKAFDISDYQNAFVVDGRLKKVVWSYY